VRLWLFFKQALFGVQRSLVYDANNTCLEDEQALFEIQVKFAKKIYPDKKQKVKDFAR
jgi:hypothetical protein